MKRRAIVLGTGSDIGAGVIERLRRDDWEVEGCRHTDARPPEVSWDLVVCCYGTLLPIGHFSDVSPREWDAAFEANFLLPARQVRELLHYRRPSASVCFFSGAGANGPAPTYSAYAASKAALIKLTELLDAEVQDCKFFILGPGMMRTKIQEQTLRAGSRAANLDRVGGFMRSGDSGTSHDAVYEFLMACVAAPKAAVGGRNFYVPGDDPTRLVELQADSHLFKLRRRGDEVIRRRS